MLNTEVLPFIGSVSGIRIDTHLVEIPWKCFYVSVSDWAWII